MLPPAPALFSITNGCLSALDIFSQMILAKVSSGPGTVVTMTRTGFAGYCASAGAARAAASMKRMDRFMWVPPIGKLIS